MPIKNLVRDQFTPTLIGSIRKGEEKGNGRPQDLDYFRVTFQPEYENLQPMFIQMYGDEPTEFRDVYLNSDKVDSCYSYWYERWAQSKLIRRCDGENIHRQYDGRAGYDDIQSPCLGCPSRSHLPANERANDCSVSATLDVIFPEFISKTGVFGAFRLRTGSIYDAMTIAQCLNSIEGLLGTLQGIPFYIGRSPREISVPMKGDRATQTKSLIYMNVMPEYMQQTLTALQTQPKPVLDQPEPVQVEMLESPKPPTETPAHAGILGKRPTNFSSELWDKLERWVKAFELEIDFKFGENFQGTFLDAKMLILLRLFDKDIDRIKEYMDKLDVPAETQKTYLARMHDILVEGYYLL